MKVQIKNKEYTVDFEHYPDSIPSHIEYSSAHKESVGVTICTIERSPEAKMHIGVAYRRRTDNYVKETGRKISLARALKDGKFDYADRSDFWKAYFARIPVKTKESPVNA